MGRTRRKSGNLRHLRTKEFEENEGKINFFLSLFCVSAVCYLISGQKGAILWLIGEKTFDLAEISGLFVENFKIFKNKWQLYKHFVIKLGGKL